MKPSALWIVVLVFGCMIGWTPSLWSDEAGTAKSVIAPGDPVAGLKQTEKGKENKLAEPDDFGGDQESPSQAIDGDVNTKYLNRVQDGSNAPGVNTGLLVTPKSGPTVVTGVQLAAANDVEDRDPVKITIEGSNDDNAMKAGAKDFTLIYEGPSGLETDPGRNAWGKAISFDNKTAYKTYRILITGTRGTTDSTQYAEVKLLGKAAS